MVFLTPRGRCRPSFHQSHRFGVEKVISEKAIQRMTTPFFTATENASIRCIVGLHCGAPSHRANFSKNCICGDHEYRILFEVLRSTARALLTNHLAHVFQPNNYIMHEAKPGNQEHYCIILAQSLKLKH